MNSRFVIKQNLDDAIAVMRKAGKWLLDSGKNPSRWWQLENLNRDFLLQYAAKEEFYVLYKDDVPAAAAILQLTQNSQDWESVDHGQSHPAFFIHWLCVDHAFSGQGLSQKLVDYAAQKAKENNISLLRVDTNASETKLRELYEKLGFKLVGIANEGYRQTAFYQKSV